MKGAAKLNLYAAAKLNHRLEAVSSLKGPRHASKQALIRSIKVLRVSECP